MKFFFYFKTLVLPIFITAILACSHSYEREQIQELIDKNLAIGPRTDNTILSIRFGDSRIGYQKKIDSLYENGIIHSLVPDSLLGNRQEISYYRYYYIFRDYDALKKIKWIFSPVFKNNRLVELALITTPVLEQSLADRSFDIDKGILKNIIDTSEEVMEDADITYRVTKAYFNRLYGTPEFISEDRDRSYWFEGNCVISIANTMTTIRIVFKDSELK